MVMRRTWALGLGLATAAGAAAAQGTRSVPVYINGARMQSDAIAITEVGRTLLPMRTLFESLGARVEWDPEQRAVYAWKENGDGVRIGLGERAAQTLRMSASPAPGNWGRVTGSHPLDAPARMTAGRIYVPLRFASEALNANVRYVANAVHISTEAVAGYREDLPSRPEPRRADSDAGRPGRLDPLDPDRESREQAERDRLERERLQRERIDLEREKQRLADERREQQRREDERLERQRQEQLRLERERQARLDSEERLRRQRPDRADPDRTDPAHAGIRNVPPARFMPRDVAVTVELPDEQFDRDEEFIPIRLFVHNNGEDPVRIPFSTGQKYNIEVLQEGRLVWSWAYKRPFSQAASTMQIQPGDRKMFEARWNLRTNDGKRVPPGNYLVRGVLTPANGLPQVIGETRITIEP